LILARAQVVLITTNYPYTYTGGETMFVAPEVRYLAQELAASGVSLVVVPQHALGAVTTVPCGVQVELGLSQMLRWRRAWHWTTACAWPGFFSQLWHGLRRGGWVGAVRVWRWAATAQATWQWARQRFGVCGPRTLFYTYWRGGATLGLLRLHSNVITRAHRYELYEDSFAPPFQPWHPHMYHQLRYTALVSQHGWDYLVQSGVPAHKLLLARLGTEALSNQAQASRDGVVRVVSSSFVVSVKRVPFLAQCLVAWAVENPQCKLCWTHFGAGPDWPKVHAELSRAPANFSATLPGYVANTTVLAHYMGHPVDLFVLLSQSEGLPVSLQEAASAGIALLATDVGGVREIVQPDTGILLSCSPSMAEVLQALNQLLAPQHAAQRTAMGKAARLRWQAQFQAIDNHTSFARQLLACVSPEQAAHTRLAAQPLRQKRNAPFAAPDIAWHADRPDSGGSH
jgi:glycosyltransferase involved in cell wall biosynthesis